MNEGKKILIVCQHFWPENFRINDIADYFVEQKCDVDALCGMPNYPTGKFHDGYSLFRNRKQVHKDVSIHRAFEIPRGNNTNFRIFLNYISFPFFSLFHIPRLLMKKYDKILLYQLSPVMMVIAGIIIGKVKKTETTLYVLDLWPENLFSVLEIKNTFLRKVVTSVSHWHYRNVDKIIVLSERMKQKIEEVTSIRNDKIIVLPQACEKIYEKDILDEKLASRFQGTFNILYTGNISPAQSFDTIIDAASKLKGDGVDNIRWIIVGDGMSRQWLENKVAENNLQDIFIFEGQKPIEDIPRYTTIADMLVGCLVKSDLLEATIPAKVMSYFAAGKPIVLAMDGEVQKLVNETIGCGYAGPTGDSAKLAANIKNLYEMSPEKRVRMGERGRDYHLKYFERNIVLGKLYSFMFS